MSEIKVGDRVKVEYEGEVLWVSSGGHEYDIRADSGDEFCASAQYITKLSPPEPPVGSVVIIKRERGRLEAFRRLDSRPDSWFTISSGPTSWTFLSQEDIIAIHEPEAS